MRRARAAYVTYQPDLAVPRAADDVDAFTARGGSGLMPDGAPWAPRPRVDNAMVKALARAFRWRKMLDTGVHATLEDLARAKGVAPSYVSRVLRLTLLAPEIVEAILDGGSRRDCAR